jgi:endonuclease/exonuclease/phosphatase family metal-dependent hydrolase
VLGLQEVVYPLQQDRLLSASGEASYQVVRGWAGRPEYGNSMLVRDSLAVSDVERVDLGLGRAAHRAVVTANGSTFLVAVAHLHSPPDDHAERVEQVQTLLAWLTPASPEAQVVVGDFNMDPREPAYAQMVDAGFRSALLEVDGREPPVTWPSGLQAEAIDTDGEPDCLDYIWFRGPITPMSARVVYDRPAVDDPGLFPPTTSGCRPISTSVPAADPRHAFARSPRPTGRCCC